jgi:uncharacterized protein YvpB
MQLRVIKATFFKQSPEDSSRLPSQDKVMVQSGQMFEIHSWKAIGKNHLRIALAETFLGEPSRNTWYVYQPDIWLINSQGRITPPPKKFNFQLPSGFGRLPKVKQLNIPHKSQLDNLLNPRGACNVTSYAMVMQYLQAPRQSGDGQLEDELYRSMENKGLSRWDPEDLAQMGRSYGLKVDFNPRSTLRDLRKAISEGYACIIHGYFTSFGHIMVVRGYDENGFYVNDPYGEWFDSGYRNDRSGENLFYSNELIQSKCLPEGTDYLWLHKITQK